MEQLYISRSYKNAIITLILLALGFLMYTYLQDPNPEENTVVFLMAGLFVVVAMITAVRGAIQLYKGRKEARNYKYAIAILGNGLGIIYLLLFIVTAFRIIPKLT